MSVPTYTPDMINHAIISQQLGLYFCYAHDERLIGIVTVMLQHPILNFVGAAGDVWGEWDVLNADFITLAQHFNCTSFEFRGRKGFLKTFKKYGMTEKFTVMTMNVPAKED
jgi:hypothetical protein